MFTVIFGDYGSRMMLWAHAFRNVTPRLGEVKKNNMELGNSIMAELSSYSGLPPMRQLSEKLLLFLKRNILRRT